MFAFGGTRTYHRMVCAIEDAGWVVKDCILFCYGSGFPKSTNISKKLDKMAGVEREVIGKQKRSQVASEGWDRPWKHKAMEAAESTVAEFNITAPATEAAKLWNGYGTALKPAVELICVAMKPNEGAYAENALKHGVAGLNIDAGRVETRDDLSGGINSGSAGIWTDKKIGPILYQQPKGRFPANFIHDGSPEVMELFPETKSGARTKSSSASEGRIFKLHGGQCDGSQGSAARFFYTAKASKSERARTTHPTVKPLSLIKYLVGLIKMPQDTLILDPFMGSGTTGIACYESGVEYVGIDLDCSEAKKRIEKVTKQHKLPGF